MRGKRVIVAEKNQIIGHHIIELLRKKGHTVYNIVVKVTDINDVAQTFLPNIIIINKSLFNRNFTYLNTQLTTLDSIYFILLYSFASVECEKLSFSKIGLIEKPFMGFEIVDMVAKAN